MRRESGPLQLKFVLLEEWQAQPCMESYQILVFLLGAFSHIQLSAEVQSKLFIMSLVITEYSISDIHMMGTDLFPLKFPLYNKIFT